MNHLRLLPLLILFGLLACTMPVTERTAIPATSVPTVYLPRVTTNVESTAAPTATATQSPVLDPTDAPTAEPSATDTAIPPTESPEPTAAGFACFGTQDGGMACTSAAGDWITPPDNGTIRAITACSDQIAIAGDELILFDGTEFALQDAPFVPTQISCAADDALWLASDTQTAVYAKGEWASHAGSPTTPIRSLAAVSKTTAWTASAVTVDRIENGTWTTYADQDGLDDTYLFEHIVAAPDGTVWAVATNTRLRFDGTEWVNQYSTPLPPLYDGIVEIDIEKIQLDVLINVLAYDEGGRFLIGTPQGLIIDNTMYTPATSPLTHPYVTQIAIVGSPTYPALQTKQNGTLTGQIIDSDGNSVANGTVTLCDHPLRRFYATTPCISPLTETTGTDGTFHFNTIPPNTYYIVYTIAGEWVGWLEAITVGDGETVDVGRLSRVQQP